MSTATQPEVSCPKCGGRMWDNRLTKRNPKQPDFKCQNRACDGVIWPPRNAPAPKPAYVQPQIASKPNSQLPPLLQNAEEEDNAELAAKIGLPPEKVRQISIDLGIYVGIAEAYLRDVVPLFMAGPNPVGCSPESVTAGIATLFIKATK